MQCSHSCSFLGPLHIMANGKKSSMNTNQTTRNQQVGLSALDTRGQGPKAVVLQNLRMAIFFYQGDGLSREVWIEEHQWKPKLWSRGHRFFFITKTKNQQDPDFQMGGVVGFEQWIERVARKGLDFGLGFMRLHSMPA